ncbi:RepB family protein [Spirosoma fluminis]
MVKLATFIPPSVINSNMPTDKSKCHPCRQKGMKQLNLFITPERKDQLKEYCKQKGISYARLINSMIADVLKAD